VRQTWWSRRAIGLHVVIIIVVPTFAGLCAWQVRRALDGNQLSWAYVFEWPFFAGYAIYMWWRFLHEAPGAGRQDQPSDATMSRGDGARGVQRVPGRAGHTGQAEAVAMSESSGGRARTSNIRLQRPTFCRLNYPGSLPRRSFEDRCQVEVRGPTSPRRAKSPR